MYTVKQLVAMGFGGYQGWGNKEADLDFKNTGGAGKFTANNIKLDEFVFKYRGMPIDFDNRYGDQCVDLIRKYDKVVLGGSGYSLNPVNYAKELYTKFTQKNTRFIQIANTANNFPKRGDIIVFKPYLGRYGKEGHVAIVLEADAKKIKVFEQNYPTGTKCAIRTTDYGLWGQAVYGWLRPIINIG